MNARPLLLALLVVAASCSTAPVASTAPAVSTTPALLASPSPSGSPAAVASTPLAVMINISGDTQTVSLVDGDGRVVASATAAAMDVEPVPFPGTPTAMLRGGPPGIGGACCGVILPEVSTTIRRVYFLSGQNQLRYLGVDGSSGLAMTLPNVRGSSQAVFAVNPDDSQIAMSVFDWSTKPMKMTISVEDIDGHHRVDIFSSTSIYEWPVAWHLGSLVLAVGSVLGGAPNPYAAVYYHVADPKTGQRLAAMGSTSCQAIGPVVAAGTLCNRGCTGADVHNLPSESQVCLDVVDWYGNQKTLYRYVSSNSIDTWAALSPDGSAAVVDDSGLPGESVVRAGVAPTVIGQADTPVAWWLDTDVVLVAGNAVNFDRAFFRVSTGKFVPLSDQLGEIQGVVPGIS